MTKLLSPITGSHFHPPAKILLTVLPRGTPLQLDPEPENPYDLNAIRVMWDPDSTPENANLFHLLDQIKDELLGSGFNIGNILNEMPDVLGWHLGYIPSSSNPKTCRGYPGNIEILAALAASPHHSATLTFAPDGSPLVQLDLGDSK